MSNETRIIHSLEETKLLADEIATQCKGGESIGLSGDLGAGKTTFSRFFLQALGVTTPVSSPTFVLCQEYTSKNDLLIEHWDLYRLTSAPDELLSMPRTKTLRLIEWWNKFPELQSQLDMILSFAICDDQKREVVVTRDQ